MRRVWLSGLAVVVAGALWAQEQETVLKVDVDLVNVLFSARDKKGALVPDLTQDDLKVLEDGNEQEIKYFTRESNLPLTLGLLVDVSVSQANLIETEKQAAAQFFSTVLRPKDMAFLISFGSDAELLQDLTNSQKLLRRGLDDLRINSHVPGFHPGPVPTASKPRGTILFDAVYLAASEKMKTEVGRKALVVITDGMDFGSRYDLRDAIEAAHRADTIIYSIHYLDHSAYGGFGASDGDLKRMSEETGGRVFRVSRKTPLPEIFRQIQEEMRTQYALAYTPSNTEKDGGFRKLEIKSSRKDVKIQARKGYYAAGD